MLVRLIEETPQLIDYLPHAISALSIISTIVITVCQYRSAIKLHKENSNYDVKKTAILEALQFVDIYISYMDFDSGIIPFREETDEQELTLKARTIHNKLCIACSNKRIIESFLDIVVTKGETIPVFEMYNRFRNECRKELGFSEIELPSDRIFISRTSTRTLNQKNR